MTIRNPHIDELQAVDTREPGTFCPSCHCDEEINPSPSTEGPYSVTQWWCEAIEEHECDCGSCGYDKDIDGVKCHTAVRWEIKGPDLHRNLGLGKRPQINQLVSAGRLAPAESWIPMFELEPAEEMPTA